MKGETIMNDDIKFKKVTYANMDEIMFNMVEKIKKFVNLSKISYVYGPPRGGSLISAHLSHHLNLEPIECLEKFKTLGTLFHQKGILFCDDVCDSGRTFHNLDNIFPANVPTEFVSIHSKPRSTFKKHEFLELVDNDVWIVYPWESDPQVDKDYMKK